MSQPDAQPVSTVAERVDQAEDRLVEVRNRIAALRDQISSRIVGHEPVVEGVLAGLLAGGHMLLEGVPGLGKTMLVKTLSAALQLDFARVQFTPDLMPADIIGTQVVFENESGGREFRFQAGPVFTQLLLADEVNRATPKTQSALLEAMEEQSVTVGRTTHPLKPPFVVLATQNPIEMEGTYPLPEAQLDRFMLKLEARFPDADDLTRIVDRTTGVGFPAVTPVMGAADVLQIRELVREVVLARHVKAFAVNLLLATHPDREQAPASVRQFVRHGASPRGLLAMILVAKAFALFEGRLNVAFDDLVAAAPLALRHRLLLNFEGEAEGIVPDQIVADILQELPRSGA